MRPLLYGLAGAGVLIALVAGPVAGQGGPGTGRPGAGGGGGVVRAGGGASGDGGARTSGSSGGGSAVAVPRSSSGGSSGSSGSTATTSSGGSGQTRGGSSYVPSSPTNGANPVVRRLYGAEGDNAVPRGARPYGNGATPYIGTTLGHAIPRQPGTPTRPPSRPPHGGGDINWGYAPWLFTGIGFYNGLYADPYWLTGFWFPYDYGYDYDPYWDPTEAAGAGYYGNEQGGVGGLKLKVEPSSAEVLVDGYSMGTVDNFNGVFQRMELTTGPHHVEIRAPGFRSIAFDVRIEPNDTVTYRGELQPLSRR